VSMVFVPTNGAGKRTLPFLLSASLLGVLGGGSPFLSIGIFLFVPLFLSFGLLRTLWLSVLHRIDLGDLSRDQNSLSTSTRS
jgi:hypothetical protein